MIKENRLIGYNNRASGANGVGATVEVSEIESLVKGALIAGDGSGAPTTLNPGTNNHVLIANSGQSTGLQYVDATSVVGAASDTAAGKVELAIASEVNTGTDTARAITPDAYAGSLLGRRIIEITVFDATTNVATGDGKAYFTIPSNMNGMNLVRAQATVVTAGTTNATTVMVHNLTDTVDMLSGAISIASGGVAGSVGTVNTSNDDVATDDRLRIDVDSVSTTPPQGLTVILEFQLP